MTVRDRLSAIAQDLRKIQGHYQAATGVAIATGNAANQVEQLLGGRYDNPPYNASDLTIDYASI